MGTQQKRALRTAVDAALFVSLRKSYWDRERWGKKLRFTCELQDSE